MNIRRALAVGAATAALAGGFAASPAQAAGGTAPACVIRSVSGTIEGFSVYLENTCRNTMRVQVIVSLAPDSRCYTLAPGDWDVYTYEGITGNYDRTAVC
ncbi:hypothetical protein [Streptomyces sparsogenes]|uniref:Beta-Ig-H3/fasciclin n=1 Tax=Streptomyces sparsogenes DSM 40356 TaxID=1331668 RepID=A0A1R1SCQ2_9ACTN|nr:hypothetical protein [Streptomyces sparsogenes]OMI35819.1 hypothetical protein SPAR_29691 [Streptomyces sparsogenes DSM 40356]